MQIKTIRYRLDNAEDFDVAVNNALNMGWQLVKRDVLQPLTSDKRTMLYAELVKLDPPPEPDRINLMAAASAIRLECNNHETCRACPLDGVCDCRAPHEWQLPGEEAQA